MSRHIAVIDVGKTNAKLALVDAATLTEIAVVTRPNTVLTGPPYPHFDLRGHWAFFLTHLSSFHAKYEIDAISITTHGAAAVLLDLDGQLAAPMLDYEYNGPDAMQAEYNALRPDFAATGSPRLGAGLNLGAQLHWLFATQNGLTDRCAHILTYPQYWGYLLTGAMATDVTSLGCHTDLWTPQRSAFSTLVDQLGLAGKIAPARHSSDVLGTISSDIAARTGLRRDTQVHCGIHDSNASLYPYLRSHPSPFSIVSTGTWVVAMAIGGAPVTLDPARDTLINVNALGAPVPSARFMGGRAYELIRGTCTATPTRADRDAVLAGIALYPSVAMDSGPFQNQPHQWSKTPQNDGQKMLALSWYLAMMTDHCLSLIGAQGPTVIEGPFAKNDDFIQMLAALRPAGVEVAASATGTSVGAALLASPDAPLPKTRKIAPKDIACLRRYSADWAQIVTTREDTQCA
ncbi:carbohydrate kinase [Thioclava sp. SK-1]|uniref:FGGY-family carbohydrate kinase n=1 Tax=Thioclava sp. SK-1 TaxID=1889770 RepID=UPI000826E2FB|nr:FGGY-family carbohydrate kinase [Thioclava sp. SK-1]OCX66949.1 carbohydrate kinase [Thioclava sp. SK-1]